jgi:hypothetical protein
MADSIRTANELTPQNQPSLGAKVVYDIPRTADLESIFVLFNGSITLSTAATSIIKDGILELITSVELSIPFSTAMQGNYARRKNGSTPSISQVGVAAAVNTFSVAGSLDLSSFATLRPKDTSLREGNYESLQLAFRFAGDFTGVYTGGGFVSSGNSLNLVVAVNETVELPDAQGKYSNPIGRVLRTSQDIIIGGASNKVQLKLTPGQALRGVVLKVTTNATPPVFSNTLLTRSRLNVGKVNRLDKAGTTITASQNHRLPVAAPVGYYFLDFADRHGGVDYLSDAIDLDPAQTNGADSILEFDVSGACVISVLQDGYIPIAAGK